MKLINELITPFNEQKQIDIEEFNHLLNDALINGNDETIIFSDYGDGYLLSLEEIEALINSINKENIHHTIFYFQLKNLIEDEKIITILNKSNIETIIINPPYGYYNQTGLFLYLKAILKKLKCKQIILQDSPINNKVCFHFQTLRKLLKTNHNIIAIYENSLDISLIGLLKHNFPELKIYVNEKDLSLALSKHLDGIISVISITFGKDFLTIFEDQKCGFYNKILSDYLLLAHDILTFSNNSTLMKSYLRRLGYKSMEERLPLVKEKVDEENIDLLLS